MQCVTSSSKLMTQRVAPRQVSSRSSKGPVPPPGPNVSEVKDILKKEHEKHGAGRALFATYNRGPQGKSGFSGVDVIHVPHLGGPYQSVDYSMYN